MPREDPPVFRSARAIAGTDSARQTSARRPAPSPQSATMFRVAPREKRDDESVTQTLPGRFRIITTVAQHAVRTLARASAFALQTGDCVN